MIWELKIPSKIQAFLWLLSRRAILTWDNLQRRGWCEPGICSLCLLEEETIQHLFMDCIYSKGIWTQLEKEVARGKAYTQIENT